MKKLLILLGIIFFLLLPFTNSVLAEEIQSMEQEEFYNLYNEESILYKSTLERVQKVGYFYHGSKRSNISIMSINNQIVFCVEPTIAAGIGETYQPIIDWEVINQDLKKELWNIIYYGYYSNPTVEFFITTQILIWQKLGFDIEPYDLNNNLFDIQPYAEEIYDQINQDNKYPSFVNQEYELSFTEETELIDTNNTLSKYEVICDETIQCLAENNALKIKINQEFETADIKVKAKEYEKNLNMNIVYGSASNKQKVFLASYAEPIYEKSLRVKLSKGNLQLIKQDEELKNIPNGATFLIATDLDFSNIIQEVQIDESGQFNLQLNCGKYYLKEINTVFPYKLNPTIWEVIVEKERANVLTIINEYLRRDLLLYKTDSLDDSKLLNGALFEIWDTTTEKKLIDRVMTGNLFLSNIDNATSYELSKTYEFDGDIKKLTPDSEHEIILPLSEGYYYLREEGQTEIKELYVYQGAIRIKDLIVGRKYEICEIESPIGYQIDSDCHEITFGFEPVEYSYYFPNVKKVIPPMGE